MDREKYLKKVEAGKDAYTIFDIARLEKEGVADIGRLPFSIRILVENLLRKLDGRVVTEEDVRKIAGWQKHYDEPVEIPYHPARVLMQDFTGVPAVVDLAAMRDAVEDLGGDPEKINPLIPVDLIVDHSVQVDFFGTAEALTRNVAREYERNAERYTLLKWAQKSFDNFRVVPPNSGICHQVNLEHLGKVIVAAEEGGRLMAYPDTLLGTDSHTTMINGIGVMGWGVGGIEAEAVMLGQPYYMSIPEVIGVRMTGKLPAGATATDLVLTVTELLRRHNVVEKFVEFFGPGMKRLGVPDRATIANMSPEYGATMGFFPVDEQTVAYLRMTDREAEAAIVDTVARELNLFYTGEADPEYSQVLDLDLSTVVPSLAGPARPQDRIAIDGIKKNFAGIVGKEYDRDQDVAARAEAAGGSAGPRAASCRPVGNARVSVDLDGKTESIGDGSIVIAAITSCTNTSNPYVMLGAGLLAKNAVRRGLRVPAYVKTSLAPGSKVVVDYLKDAALLPYLEAVGFHLVAFGCTTCIGNSGPLRPEIERAIEENDLTAAAVLSGNRNFEARIHQNVRANFLASPMLVVAFALAGRIDIDLSFEPLGFTPDGSPVYLDDIWPGYEAIDRAVKEHVKTEYYRRQYGRIFDGDEFWRDLPAGKSTTFSWDEDSTYIKNPPYFTGFSLDPAPPQDVEGARALLVLGDSVTTDHISPAGAIPEDYPAGRYLIEKGVEKREFNSYGSRRGNHEVMMRGTFGNIRIKNRMVDPKEGSYTRKFPENEERFVFDAAMAYMDEETPLLVLGGKEYGTGSSRDWAAKGTTLLGVRAVIAESFERIHRSNLVGMGVLPLVFADGATWQDLKLDGSETYRISGIEEMAPRKTLEVTAVRADGTETAFSAVCRLDTVVDVDYFRNGGILPYVLRKLMG